ncbi:hypothetical protein OFN51_35965, partial [Escherichia coli]|nr:hypothetical protein [Escherichia coli]
KTASRAMPRRPMTARLRALDNNHRCSSLNRLRQLLNPLYLADQRSAALFNPLSIRTRIAEREEYGLGPQWLG